MQVRTMLLTLGAGAALGALGALMLPKNSAVYQTASDAASAIRQEAGKIIDSMS